MLLTGFEGYGGRQDNPSAIIASLLDGKTIGNTVVTSRVLPVTNHNLQRNITALIDELRPSTVLCLGLAPGENMIRLERVAANHSHFEIPDNAGERYCGPVLEGGVQAYATTLPVNDLLAAILDRGVPARISETAGTYLCNAVMYHALCHCELYHQHTRCGFIHLPYMPSQVCDLVKSTGTATSIELHQRADLSSMAIETQLAAITAVIESLAEFSGAL